MKIKDIVPWKRGEGRALSKRAESDPFVSLHQEMNRLFEDFGRGFLPAAFDAESRWPGLVHPSLDVSETDAEVHVTAELPGLTEADIELTLADGALVLRGEKKSEKREEDEKHEYVRTERSYGSFHRVVPLPAEVDAEKVDATFRNGVLTVVLPKVAPTGSGKKIAVRRTE